MIKMLMIMLGMIFLTSCNSPQRKIICKDVKRATIPPLVFCDADFEKMRCRCSCFDMNKNKTVKDNKCDKENEVFKSGNYPLKECDQIVGPTLQDWSKYVRPNIRRLYKIKTTNCK